MDMFRGNLSLLFMALGLFSYHPPPPSLPLFAHERHFFLSATETRPADGEVCPPLLSTVSLALECGPLLPRGTNWCEIPHRVPGFARCRGVLVEETE